MAPRHALSTGFRTLVREAALKAKQTAESSTEGAAQTAPRAILEGPRTNLEGETWAATWEHDTGEAKGAKATPPSLPVLNTAGVPPSIWT